VAAGTDLPQTPEEAEAVHSVDALRDCDICEAGARTLYHARSFAWLARILRPGQA
jgi:hypothetical protein